MTHRRPIDEPPAHQLLTPWERKGYLCRAHCACGWASYWGSNAETGAAAVRHVLDQAPRGGDA